MEDYMENKDGIKEELDLLEKIAYLINIFSETGDN